MKIEQNKITVFESSKINSANIKTEPYPGFPTDLQAQIMVLMLRATGISKITENIFENRFMHVPELRRMGAKIVTKNNIAFIKGPTNLSGAEVMATDLRASVSLVLAALIAENRTIINRVYHLDRGYEDLEKKLKKCNASIKMKVKNLKLLATSDEDLKVIAAHLQDAIVSLSDIANLKQNRIFLIQLNRFMWEDVEKGIFRKNKRIRTILKFDNIISVSSKNININENKIFLDFLTIECNSMPDKSYEIRLIFSGDAVIKIKTEVIDVTLDDQGLPWESKTQPKHNFL